MEHNNVNDDDRIKQKRIGTEITETMVVRGDRMFRKHRTEFGLTNTVENIRPKPSRAPTVNEETDFLVSYGKSHRFSEIGNLNREMFKRKRKWKLENISDNQDDV